MGDLILIFLIIRFPIKHSLLPLRVIRHLRASRTSYLDVVEFDPNEIVARGTLADICDLTQRRPRTIEMVAGAWFSDRDESFGKCPQDSVYIMRFGPLNELKITPSPPTMAIRCVWVRLLPN